MYGVGHGADCCIAVVSDVVSLLSASAMRRIHCGRFCGSGVCGSPVVVWRERFGVVSAPVAAVGALRFGGGGGVAVFGCLVPAAVVDVWPVCIVAAGASQWPVSYCERQAFVVWLLLHGLPSDLVAGRWWLRP